MNDVAVLVLILLGIFVAGLAIGTCAIRADAGNERSLVPLATCTSQPFLREGEIHGCDGWAESTDGSAAWGYGRRGADGVVRWVRATP